MRYRSGFAPAGMCYWPLAVAAIAYAGAGAYSSHQEAGAAKKAAEAQERVGMAEIEASLQAPKLAAQAAKDKLRAKQASATQSILTAPGGLEKVEENVNQRSILGV